RCGDWIWNSKRSVPADCRIGKMSDRTVCRQNFQLLAMMLWFVTFSTGAKGTSSGAAINLDVSQTNDSYAFLIVNCSIQNHLSVMKTVASLTVYGSKSHGMQNKMDELADIDIWSQTPKLVCLTL
ncbi:protein vac14, partial [Plakobranchus ocellatus]